jgi:3D (Asp-Asp-Asp) domain-containing protein
MSAAKAIAGGLILLLAIPVIALVAIVGLFGGDEQAACQSLATPLPTTGAAGAGGGWIATAYGPPWNALNGSGITATGINLTASQPALLIAVDPSVIALGSYEHVTPNPFRTGQAFLAGDTGGAIIGKHVDIYDWQGRSSQLAWGERSVSVTAAPDPGTGPLLDEITPTASSTVQTGTAAGCPVAYAGPLPLTAGQQATILPSGLAAAPRDAPAAVKLAIAAGNELIGKPYLWGGGHGVPLTEFASGYDCSGSTSYILHAAGAFGLYAEDSTELEAYGQAGPGRWITVYANSAHAFVDVAGVVMDTAWYAPVQPTNPDSGPRWQPESIIGPQYAGDVADGHGGFVQRHPQGL